MVLRYSGRRKERGFTLTELAIVLSVIGAILGAIWAAAAHVHDRQKVERGNAQIIQILNNYRTLYAQHGVDVTDWTDVTCNGVNANFFPGDMANTVGCTATDTTKPLTPWANSYASVWGIQSTQAIIIGYDNLPQSACENLMLAATTSPDVVYQRIKNSVADNSNTVSAANAAWGATQVDGNCTADSSNEIMIGYKAR